MEEDKTGFAGFVITQLPPWTPKKRTFRKVLSDLSYAANCLVAIGEQELGDKVGRIVEKMNDHAECGDNHEAAGSEEG